MTIQDWLRSETDHVTLAIVFTDIVGSTALQRDLGDSNYNPVREAHFTRARHYIPLCGGHEVKTIGDSFYAVFRTAVSALKFAIELHGDTGDERVIIRAGIHVGAVRINKEGDVFGSSVNFTKRVMDSSPPGGLIMLSRDAKSQIDFEKPPDYENMRFSAREKELAGFEGKHQVFAMMTPKMRQEKVKRAREQSLPSKLFFGSHSVD
jgi:class 3 adenylate cyclase